MCTDKRPQILFWSSRPYLGCIRCRPIQFIFSLKKLINSKFPAPLKNAGTGGIFLFLSLFVRLKGKCIFGVCECSFIISRFYFWNLFFDMVFKQRPSSKYNIYAYAGLTSVRLVIKPVVYTRSSAVPNFYDLSKFTDQKVNLFCLFSGISIFSVLLSQLLISLF